MSKMEAFHFSTLLIGGVIRAAHGLSLHDAVTAFNSSATHLCLLTPRQREQLKLRRATFAISEDKPAAISAMMTYRNVCYGGVEL